MNLFNRIAMTIVLVLLVLAAVGIIFVALFMPVEGLTAARGLFSSMLTNVNTFNQVVVAVCSGILGTLFFFLLMVELNPKKIEGVELPQVKNGAASISISSVVQRVRQSVEQIPQVRRAEPIVTSHGKTVDIKLNLFLDPAADVPTKTEEAASAIRGAAETGLGIKIRKVEIKVKHEVPSTQPALKA